MSNIHPRDRRKWFGANFGRSYFRTAPPINPSIAIGLAIPCAAMLLLCLCVVAAHFGDTTGGFSLAIPPLVLVGLSREQLLEKKTQLLEEAKKILNDAAAAGKFEGESERNYEDLKEQIKAINEKLGESGPASPAEEIERQMQLGQTRERTRVEIINETVTALRLPQSFATRHIKDGTSIETFRKLAIDEAKVVQARLDAESGIGAVGTPVSDPRLRDEADERRFAMVGALLERFEPHAWAPDERERNFVFHPERGQRIHEGSRRFIGMSLLDVAKECLTNVGIRWQAKNKSEIVRLAFMSTSDFPYILADSANKSLRAGYDAAPSQWRLIAARRTAADFKTMYELTLDSSSRLTQVKSDGEFQHGALVEGRESYALKTYGKIIGVTRQVIINDDLGAFTRAPLLLGQEVAQLEASTVIGIITTNGNLSDSVALFEKNTHKNYDDTAAAISVDTIGALRVLMMLQTGTGGKVLGTVPRYLVAPATKGQIAIQYTSANYQASESAKINPWAGTLVPIVEPLLDASDVNDWYLFADPNTPNGTVLVYAYLEGQEGPYTETRQGFEVDGVEIKIRLDFGAGAVDYRGAVKKAGA